jgi:integrase
MRAWEIKATDVEQYRLKRLSEFSNHKTPYRSASVNREIEVLKRIFNLAMRDGLVQHNPCWKVKRLPEDNVRKRVLSQEELRKLIAELPPHAADLVIVGYWTGMRLGEILNLTWDRVNLKEGYFRLTEADTKTREPRDVYFSESVHNILERIRKGKLSNIAYVFTYNGLPIKNIKTALTRAKQKAGIENFCFHDLRHTFVTNARRAGVDQTVIMKLTGHKTLSMFTRYDSVEPRDAQDALKKLDALLKDAEDDTAAILLQ